MKPVRVGSISVRALLLAAGAGLAMLAMASPARAQPTTTVSAGWVWPRGGLDDRYDRGVIVRARRGFPLLIAELHIQGGFTRLPGAQPRPPGADPSGLLPASADAANLLHAGMGLRVGLGLLWVGGTAAWFVGDLDDEMTFLPEVGLRLGPTELVGEVRWGERRWAALRAGVRF
ncbi:MAG: hypothetical protein HKO98_10680 [Gemmatimonadetes bacterium]|nr:hypothetical protein [Gemmatimonadota bacterium]